MLGIVRATVPTETIATWIDALPEAPKEGVVEPLHRSSKVIMDSIGHLRANLEEVVEGRT